MVASAITDKGVTTASDATFSTIATNVSKIVTKSALTNWQIGGSRTGSGANDIYTVGNKLFTLGQASNGYLSLTLKTLKPCYITITKYIQTSSNEGAEATPTVIKKNEYVNAGYTWNSPYESNVIHIFAYTL